MKRRLLHSICGAATFGIGGLLLATGCDQSATTNRAGATLTAPEATGPDYTQLTHADVVFETPYRLKTSDGGAIEFASPGYASPTLADIDQDGDEDLIVGLFAAGNMRLFRNQSAVGDTPVYDGGEWITSADHRAEVPGVS